jgi:uncharacterized membrane protein YphA (DoxX/SURF4 family)
MIALLPALAWAHERWVQRVERPFNRDYFRSMSGEVLFYSLCATMAIAGVVAAWYLVAVPLVEHLTLHGTDARAREARRPPLVRWLRRGARFFLDGNEESTLLARGERIALEVFKRLPAAVLALGVVEGWFVMPSFPLHGQTAPVVRVVAGALALWCLSGLFLRQLGVAFLVGFLWLVVDYGAAAVDAVPVLASASLYLFATDPARLNPRQLAGMRVSLGVGFFLLGLINKIYHAELFISVGDAFPQLVENARKVIPDLTREAWSFTTALAEMTFGLLLLLGLFDKLATLALAGIFAHFITVFGWAEIVHLYPIMGFVVLFFHAPPGTVLDGAVFRAHVRLWHRAGHTSSPALYPVAVGLVAMATAALLMFLPLYLFIEIIPRLGG